jgi:hypothetical protein
MENVQGKKPAEWFKQLKEPYRSQAIENINSESINLYCKSIIDALYDTFTWVDTPQGDKQWVDIHNSIKAGETTYLEPENVSLINEVNNTQVTEQQNQIEPEKVETDWKAKFEELQKRYEVLVTEAHKLDILSGEMCDKYTELKQQLENQNNQEKVYIHYNSKQEKWLQADTLELALQQSEDNKNIYEAVKIGVKKSILVNE